MSTISLSRLSIESNHSQTPSSIENLEDENDAMLPPLDHGRQAYLVLAGCTLIQAPVWGYPLSFGVFQEYYTTHHAVEGSSGAIATVGTSLTGIMYLMMPLLFTLLTRYPHLRPYCGPLGLAITVSSLLLSSFATKVWQLIASQGVLCAIGSGLLFSPTSLYLDEWFVSRKGLAYGVMWAGKSVAGVVLPFVMQRLLTTYGPQTTLRAWAVALFVMTAPMLFFLKPRVPIGTSASSTTNSRRHLSWTFLRSTNFWMLQLGNVIQSFGYFLPSTYLASFAHDLGLSDLTGSILIAVFNFASIPGGLVIGMLGDRFSASTVILISSLGSAVGVFVFWGLSSANLVLLVLFAIVYGFFAGGFSSTWPSILQQLTHEDEGVDASLVMGLLLGGRGIGNVISGPISSALLDDAWSTSGKLGYDTVYGPIILFTGVTSLLGGWGWIWKAWKRITI